MLNVLAHTQKYFFRAGRIIQELLGIMKLLVLKKITSRASVTQKKPESNNKKAMLILT